MTRRKTQEQAREMFASRGATMVGEYVGTKTPVECVCDTCGATGWPTYGHVQGGRGACATCGYARRTKEQTKPEAETRAIAIAGGFTPSVPYSGNHTPWKGTCHTCGETVSPTLSSVQSGNGACIHCAGRGYDATKPGYLYLMAGDHDGLPWLKVGITNRAPADRAKDVGGTIIDSVLYENGADAHRDEQEILGQLGDLRGTGIPQGGDGYTESWSAWLMTVTTLTELRERYAVAA